MKKKKIIQLTLITIDTPILEKKTLFYIILLIIFEIVFTL